jgi:histidinol phosphatase-like enzyme (inositol monophosphatase family)
MSVDSSLRSRYTLACRIAATAARGTLRHFRNTDTTVEYKADESPVTVADRGAERYLRAQISAAFPHDTIVGEEYGEKKGSSPFRWILDPIDGTRAFVSGVPLYGTLVGLQRDEQSVAGIIDMPALGESLRACRGAGAWYTRRGKAPVRPRVSACAELGQALFVTSERRTFDARRAGRAYTALERACRFTRTWGDCYGYLLVATGRAELMIDPIMNVWDAAAMQPILEEAGGVFTDWSGRATVTSGEGVACNARLLPQVLNLLR